MGLHLRRIAFQEWVKSVWEPLIPGFLEKLEKKSEQKSHFKIGM